MKKTKRIFFTLNLLIISGIFVLNYFYQKNGFDFTLKCICSGAFALLGIINLVFAIKTKQENPKFYVFMASGLLLAFLGDVLIGCNFIVGTATFALGHVCFVASYCLIDKMRKVDCVISGVIFLCAASFLMFSPLLSFDVSVFRVVCIVYALIISTMLGKSIGNLVHERSLFTVTVAIASVLFVFSDLMLVFDWFIGLWSWTDHACMGTYYPALCLLALSMMIKSTHSKK